MRGHGMPRGLSPIVVKMLPGEISPHIESFRIWSPYEGCTIHIMRISAGMALAF